MRGGGPTFRYHAECAHQCGYDFSRSWGGSKLLATQFLNLETVGILILGVIAFAIGTASGVLLAKLMNRLSSMPINPLIGAAGVSAVPMAARVVNHVGLQANPQNHLVMHAMGPNVSGVIGSAVAAGVLLSML